MELELIAFPVVYPSLLELHLTTLHSGAHRLDLSRSFVDRTAPGAGLEIGPQSPQGSSSKSHDVDE